MDSERERYQRGEPLDAGALWMTLTDDTIAARREQWRTGSGSA